MKFDLDSLTHIASGALIGELIAGKRLGKRAMIIGALAQSLPDIDTLASLFLDPTDNLLFHRGITHSLIFTFAISALLAVSAHRTHRNHTLTIADWYYFFLAEIATHLFLDAFNNYGVGWFEPFSHIRISFNTLYVVDPFYTIPLVISFAVLGFVRKNTKVAVRVALCGLILSSAYLAYSVYHKLTIDNIVRSDLQAKHLSTTRFFTTPTAFNTWLWYVVAQDSSGFHVGYHSVLDNDRTIALRFFPQKRRLLQESSERKDLSNLKKFSQGYFTIEQRSDTLVFNDLRFGQIAGWTDAKAPFVFHYYVNYPDENLLVVQRGRFAGWNKQTVGALITRIRGN